MALAHSRRPSMAGFKRRPPRITIQVIRSAAKTAMSQTRTSCNVSAGNSSQKAESVIKILTTLREIVKKGHCDWQDHSFLSEHKPGPATGSQ